MTEKATKTVLERLGFDLERAEELAKGGISTKTIIGKNHIVIEAKDNKDSIVYSERAGARKYYFESGGLKFPTHCDKLIGEYYNLKETLFLEKRKQSFYSTDILKKQFFEEEVEKAERNIIRIKEKYPMLIKEGKFSTENEELYLKWLKDKNITDPGTDQSNTLETEATKKGKTEITLFDFIHNVTDEKAFANDLKDTFKTEKGIDFKIMIELLKEENILLISGGFAAFYRVIKPHFSQIGTRAGLNDLYKHNDDEQKYYAEKIEIIKNKLKPLIDKYKA